MSLLSSSVGQRLPIPRRRWNLLRIGAAENRFDRPAERLKATFRYGVANPHAPLPLAGFAHMLIFSGFVVLLFRTLILWGRGFDESFNFWIFGHHHLLGKAYSFLKDVFALLVILGTLVFVYFRVLKRLPRMTLSREGLLILGIIFTMMAADILYDAATAAHRATMTAGASAPVLPSTSPNPQGPSQPTSLPISPAAQNVLGHVGFWTHSALVLLFLNLLPYSKHFHVITGIPNVYFQNLRPPGRLPPIEDLEGKLEREETLGIRRINQFSWKSILDFYTCTECGRCSDHCPATSTGKKLSPSISPSISETSSTSTSPRWSLNPYPDRQRAAHPPLPPRERAG